MTSATWLIVGVTGVLAILSGWILPILFKSRRPIGVLGDIVACTVVAAGLAFVEYRWILPALGFGKGWITVLAAVGDPLGAGWVVLWLIRKLKS